MPGRNLKVSRATPSDQPTTLTFDLVRSSGLRLDMTSVAPGTGAGFLQIVELRVLSGGTAVNSPGRAGGPASPGGAASPRRAAPTRPAGLRRPPVKQGLASRPPRSNVMSWMVLWLGVRTRRT